jgi:hypothetical protein
MGIDPGAFRELLEERAVEPARGAVIDIFDRGLMAQPGIAQAGEQRLSPQSPFWRLWSFVCYTRLV